MGAQHTPGPWFVDQDDKRGQAVVRSRDIEIATCWHHSVGFIEKEMRHNARLIAAAPDMLAALESFVDGFDPDREYEATDTAYVVFGEKAKLALAAIAKARGEGA